MSAHDRSLKSRPESCDDNAKECLGAAQKLKILPDGREADGER
jgi:hypothetical protein